MTKTHTAFFDIIVVDWGTTNFRAALVGTDGKTKANIETSNGIQSVQDGAFETVLMEAISPWLDAYGPLTVVALGMVTSRSGWIEVPYVTLPAAASELAAGTINQVLPNGSKLIFLPGITDMSGQPFPDVMRGEETQIVGHGLDHDAIVVLPGTHSKWAKVKDKKIEGFQTFVTGEIFALLSQHSFIAKTGMHAQTNAPNWSAFDKGVVVAQNGEGGENPFLSVLFSARTGMLANELKPADMLDYVSGLLIGYEFREALNCSRFSGVSELFVVGNDGLNDRYIRTANALSLDVYDAGAETAIQGVRDILSSVTTE